MDGAHYLYVEIDRPWDADPERPACQKLFVHPVLAHLCADPVCERTRLDTLASSISALVEYPVKVETSPLLFFSFRPTQALGDLGTTDLLYWTRQHVFCRCKEEFRWAPYDVSIAGVMHGDFYCGKA